MARRSVARRVEVSFFRRRSAASIGSPARSWRQVRLTQKPELRRISATRSGDSYVSPHEGQTMDTAALLACSPVIPIIPPPQSPPPILIPPREGSRQNFTFSPYGAFMGAEWYAREDLNL